MKLKKKFKITIITKIMIKQKLIIKIIINKIINKNLMTQNQINYKILKIMNNIVKKRKN